MKMTLAADDSEAMPTTKATPVTNTVERLRMERDAIQRQLNEALERESGYNYALETIYTLSSQAPTQKQMQEIHRLAALSLGRKQQQDLCPKCNDTGWIETTISPAHSQEVACGCVEE